MNRKEFLTKSILGLGATCLPLSFNIAKQEFLEDELIGKKRPELFGVGFNLRDEAAQQFSNMRKAAKERGFHIYSVSSYRSFAHQNRIWERKYKKYKEQGLSPERRIQQIIQYSTIPGTSRHHWGTDLDIVDSTNGIPSNPLSEKKFMKGGPFYGLKKWLDEHAVNYGFYETYTNNKNRKGFAYEPWHFSYKPTALSMLEAYKELDLKKVLQKHKVIGSSHFSDEFIAQYRSENILDINPDLLS